MKPASPALIAFLASNSDLYYVDLWTITLTNGTVLRYSAGDLNVTISGNFFNCNDVLVAGGAKISDTVGLQVNEADLTLYPAATSMAGSVPFYQAIAEGMFNRAAVTGQRLFMPTWGDTSLGAVTIFVGQITDVNLTRNTVEVKCKDLVNLLNIYMPRRQYQPTCSWVFGDANCGFDRAGQAVSSSIGSGSSASVINCGLSQSAGFFNNGTVKATSGLNAGISRTIKYYQTGIIQLVAPFPNAFAIGDAITVTPGCTKNFGGAVQNYNGSALTGSTPNVIISGLSNASGYFNNGTLLFTSGANTGQSRIVSSWANGQATMSSPFPNAPAIGDTFQISSSSGNTTGSCTGYFSTAAAIHFGGQPYVPVPETAF